MEEEKVLTPDEGTEQPQEEAATPQEPSETAPSEPVESPEATPEADPVPETETPDFWKKKATEQAKENIVLNEKLRQQESRRELTKEPAESDVRAAFPEVDWEFADPAIKRALTESFRARQASEILLRKESEREAAAKWNTDLEFAIAKNPSLLGKEQAFKEFASKPSRRGVDTDTLVKAFLFDAAAAPKKTSTPSPTLEAGNGGPRGPISSKPKYSAEEIMAIQKADPRKYRDMLMAGDFDD